MPQPERLQKVGVITKVLVWYRVILKVSSILKTIQVTNIQINERENISKNTGTLACFLDDVPLRIIYLNPLSIDESPLLIIYEVNKNLSTAEYWQVLQTLKKIFGAMPSIS